MKFDLTMNPWMNLKCLINVAYFKHRFKRHLVPYLKRLIKNDFLHLQNTKRDTALDNLNVLELYYQYIYTANICRCK
jgi:hypothetical protein